MDALDMRILRDIGIEPFAGSRSVHPWRPEALAERLGQKHRLVKDRLARLEGDGVIAGYGVMPNLAYLGLAARTYAFAFATRARRAEVLRDVGAMEGVLAVVDYVTDWATVTIAFADDDERERRLAEVRHALGGPAPETWFEMSLPAKARELTSLELRILRAWRGNARATVRELAGLVGVTTKTVQRRLDQMLELGAFSVFAVLDAGSMDELLLCTLVIGVDMSDRPKLEAGMAAFHHRLMADSWSRCSAPIIHEGVHHDVVVAPSTPRALADLLQAAAQAPGVRYVKAHLASGVTWSSQWLDGQLEALATSNGAGRQA